MPIYYLEPKEGDTSDERWEASSLKEGRWTVADTEDLARRQVGQATFEAVSPNLDGSLVYSPWMQKRLVDCNCPPSALMRQIGRVEEGRISGSS